MAQVEHAEPRFELRIGRYVVETKLGEGGMAETWLGRLEGARGFSKKVVIKTIKPSCMSPEYESMFIDEARIGARLEHPNIPRVTEFGQMPTGMPFMVQEYVDGPSIAHLLNAQAREGTFNLRMACRIASDVASALDFAYRLTDEHGRPLSVVHRDISPSNILVSRRGVAKLIDFGVASFADRETHTQTGILKGKLRFMAPEAVMRGETSHQGDLYSLGVVLYRMCVGDMPSPSDRSGPGSSIEDPRLRRPDVDAELAGIIMQCLQIHRARRFATGGDLKYALDRWMRDHGGIVSDDEIAGRISMMFPGGPREWHSREMTMSSLRSASLITHATARRHGQRPLWMALFAAVGLLLAASAVLALAALWLMTGPPKAPGIAKSRDVGLERRLDGAFVALIEGRVGEAEALLSEANAMSTDDPQLITRRAKLSHETKIHVRIRDIRALGQIEPTRALGQALELRDIHPGDEDVSALIRDLRELQPPEPADIPTAPIVPKPAPVTPKRAPRNNLLKTRVGRSPGGE